MLNHEKKIAYFGNFLLFFALFVLNNKGAHAFVYLRHCDDSQYLIRHPHTILKCAQKEFTIPRKNIRFIRTYKTDDYTQFTYQYRSIRWPHPTLHKTVEPVSPDIWTQRLTIFIPNRKQAQNKTALLYITGGINHPVDTTTRLVPDNMISELVKHHIVIVLRDIPNHYLLIEVSDKKEDAIVAYTWQRFIENPDMYFYYPLHIPMTVAARQAMTMAQLLLKKQGYQIKKFIAMGLSKRGWTTWLTGLTDPRVIAIIPMVIDILHTTKQVPHIHNVYGQHWPSALIDYKRDNILKYAQPNNPLHANYLKLMKLVDPFTYLNENTMKKKIKALKKYIVNSSGDDFFTPDGSRFYYGRLPGMKGLFYIPNSTHDIRSSSQAHAVAQSLLAFYDRVAGHIKFPVLKWNHNREKIRLHSSELPVQATLWTASNKVTRDMRFGCGIVYNPLNMDIHGKSVAANLQSPKKGWQAAFIVLRYKDNLLESTPVFITPEKFPKPQQIMPQKENCRIID